MSSYGALSADGSLDEDRQRGRCRATLFSCFLCIVAVGEGYDIGVLNGAVVRVKDEFDASVLQISLIVAVTPFAVMPGSLLGGALADEFGRWPALLATCIILTASPIAMALAGSIEALIWTRAVVGLGIGMGMVVSSMYIAEVAPTEMRGGLTALIAVFMNLGILVGYLMNWYLLGVPNDWRWMLGLGSVLPALLLVMMFAPDGSGGRWLSESPRWLFAHGREEDARAVLARFLGLRRADEVIADMREQAKGDASVVTWTRFFEGFSSGKERKMLLAGLAVPMAAMLCGYLAVAYYSSSLMKESAGERLAFLATIVMGLVKLLVVIIVVAVLDRVGRRPILLSSVCLTSAAVLWLAMVFLLRASWHWQAFGFCFFMASFELGLGALMFVYPAEIFPTAWRAKGSSLAIFLSRVVGCVSLFIFPLVVEAWGAGKTFAIQFLVCLVATACLAAFVFETKGVSLESVGQLFSDH